METRPQRLRPQNRPLERIRLDPGRAYLSIATTDTGWSWLMVSEFVARHTQVECPETQIKARRGCTRKMGAKAAILSWAFTLVQLVFPGGPWNLIPMTRWRSRDPEIWWAIIMALVGWAVVVWH